MAFRLFSTNPYSEPENWVRDPDQRCLWTIEELQMVIKVMGGGYGVRRMDKWAKASQFLGCSIPLGLEWYVGVG